MVGTALKKYAERAGLTCDGGYVYGKIRHRHIALVDGTGVKLLQIYLGPPACAAEDVRMLQAKRILENCDVRRYRLIRQNAVNVGGGRAVVAFLDGPGAMDRIERYISEVMPRLDDIRLDGDACACCGEPLGEAAGYVLLDDYILPVHPECIPEITAQKSTADDGGGEGSLVRGTVGALLGAVAGAALWAALYLAGFVAGVAGFFVGLFSNGFYGLFRGRRGRTRTVIVTAALILGVLAGQLGGMAAMYGKSAAPNAMEMSRGQYVLTRFEQILISDQETALRRAYERTGTEAETQEEYICRNWNPEYSANRSEELCEFWVNLGMGLTFGGLSIQGLFFRKNREMHRSSPRRLK